LRRGYDGGCWRSRLLTGTHGYPRQPIGVHGHTLAIVRPRGSAPMPPKAFNARPRLAKGGRGNTRALANTQRSARSRMSNHDRLWARLCTGAPTRSPLDVHISYSTQFSTRQPFYVLIVFGNASREAAFAIAPTSFNFWLRYAGMVSFGQELKKENLLKNYYFMRDSAALWCQQLYLDFI
jgi:hypothetical protein